MFAGAHYVTQSHSLQKLNETVPFILIDVQGHQMIEAVLTHGAPPVDLDAPHGRERAFTDSVCGRHD